MRTANRFVMMCLSLSLFAVSMFIRPQGTSAKNGADPAVKWIKFLITVNDTWNEQGCIATVKTAPIYPGKQSGPITVGTCDHGPLVYSISNTPDGNMTVFLTFYSSVVLDASHPSCQITWNGNYLVPKTLNLNESLLPACFTADSREGYHMTFYWFHLLEWEKENL